ncbi:hypothetical protein F5B20DRAFT_288132 [Whalleya microplaca]|nr:hypothetical protein F5B20DRAFT_288132 [Whalleya microplaca]
MAKDKDMVGVSNAHFYGDDEQNESMDLSHDTPRDISMKDAPVFGTPRQAGASTPYIFGSGSASRPVTRSMSRVRFDDAIISTSTSTPRLFDRFRDASTKATRSSTHSNLEDSRDIQYRPVQAEEEEGTETGDQPQPFHTSISTLGHPHTGQLRVPVRRSARIQGSKALVRESTPSTTLAPISQEVDRIRKKGKRGLIARDRHGRFTRRSSRLMTPLLEFHMYSKLPDEIKIMIWEAAISPRVAYICNRSSLAHFAAPFGVQNKLPTWFTACRLSAWVAQKNYQKMFALHGPRNEVDNLPRQDINPDVDIVIFEPCHNGCRGYHCARHQYCDADRNAIRFLAIQTESRHLVPTAEPCWQTISRSWPNVVTLYLMRVALKGVGNGEKALIRVKETDDELELQKRFKEWKKGPGKEMKVAKMEFVTVVDRETEPKHPKDRYRDIAERQTGLPEDIILG